MLNSRKIMALATRFAVGLAAVGLLFAVIVYGLSYRASNPTVSRSECGDATLLDKGKISLYPRLQLSFPLIALETRTTEFEVTGCTLDAPLELWLVVEVAEGATDAPKSGVELGPVDQIKASEVTVSYKVTDIDGLHPQSVFSGRLGDSWAFEGIGGMAYFSQRGERLQLESPYESGFKLAITVQGGENTLEEVYLRPVLAGGGFEK